MSVFQIKVRYHRFRELRCYSRTAEDSEINILLLISWGVHCLEMSHPSSTSDAADISGCTLHCTCWAGDESIWEQGCSHGHVLFCSGNHFPWLHCPGSQHLADQGVLRHQGRFVLHLSTSQDVEVFQGVAHTGKWFFSLISVGTNEELWDHSVLFC